MVVVCPAAVRAAFGFVATDPPPTGVKGAAAVPGVIATPPAQESAGSGTLALMAACSAASVAAYMASKEGPDQVDAGGVPVPACLPCRQIRSNGWRSGSRSTQKRRKEALRIEVVRDCPEAPYKKDGAECIPARVFLPHRITPTPIRTAAAARGHQEGRPIKEVDAPAPLATTGVTVRVPLITCSTSDESSYTFGSFAIGSRYPLNQLQQAPAGGVPQGGTDDAGCVQVHAPACLSDMQRLPASANAGFPHCCGC